jgi:hypothetical protein
MKTTKEASASFVVFGIGFSSFQLGGVSYKTLQTPLQALHLKDCFYASIT